MSIVSHTTTDPLEGHSEPQHLAPSERLARWIWGKTFDDTIAVRSSAAPAELMQAFERVTLRDMPLARAAGTLRYLPAHLGAPRDRDAARRARRDAQRPFLMVLTDGGGSLILERAADELIVGTIGKLHQLADQELVSIESPMHFLTFAQADHEKLAMSVRAIAEGDHSWLVLEHRTLPLDARARRRFRRYWRWIRPAGAFVTRQLLRATAREAERMARRHLEPPARAACRGDGS